MNIRYPIYEGVYRILTLSLCNAYFKANPFSVRPIYYQTEKGREVVLEQTLLFLFVPSVSYTYKF